MKKLKWFLFGLIALLLCVSAKSSSTVFASGLTVNFNYNLNTITEHVPEDWYQGISNSSVSTTYGGLVSDNVSIANFEYLKRYYEYEWTVNGQIVDLDTYRIYNNTTLVARWKPIEYTITYHYPFDSSIVSSLGLKLFDTYSIEKQINFYKPNRPNYIFEDWFLSQDYFLDEIALFTTKYDIGDKTLYAKFRPKEYAITYHTDAINLDNPTSYNVESPRYNLQAPEKEGHIFLGWYLDIDCTYPISTIESKSLSGNIDLYPLWKLETKEVKYVLPNGDIQVVEVEYGKEAPAPNVNKSIFQVLSYDKSRKDITKDTIISVKLVSIWYVYVLGLVLLAGIIMLIIYLHKKKTKQMHKLKYIYSSNLNSKQRKHK